jgi:translation initiation factor 4A
MNLCKPLLCGIYGYGFERPSALQRLAIKPCILGGFSFLFHRIKLFYVISSCSLGHDVIAQAQSGTGKIATFAIPILQQLNMEFKDCQVLILTSTRERAQKVCFFYHLYFLFINFSLLFVIQIQKVVLGLGDYMGVTCHACIGGTNVRDDMKRLEGGVQIVVGTPGRVYDMLSRSALRTFEIFNQSFSMFLI